MRKNYKRNIEELRKVTDIQKMPGNWNYDPYMHGMANGLILALHIVDDGLGIPEYLNAPKEGWISNKKCTIGPSELGEVK